MPRVLSIGDLMLDVIAQIGETINYGSDTPSKISTHGGGAAANVAAWASSAGADSYLLARVGNDAAGKTLLTELDELGVHHANMVVQGVQSGVVIVLVDPSGERTMFPERGANSGLTLADLPDLAGVEMIYLSGYALLDPESRAGILEMIALFHHRQIPICFDPASVGAMELVELTEARGWLSLMQSAIMNEEEAIYLSGCATVEQALELLLLATPTVIIKRGAAGVLGRQRSGETIVIPAQPVKVIDTTGAGDSFAGGYLAAQLLGKDLESCLQAGVELAAKCVAIVGARPQVTPAL